MLNLCVKREIFDLFSFHSHHSCMYFYKQSLDGFALALAADGRFLYISETVSIYLGLSQVSLTTSMKLKSLIWFTDSLSKRQRKRKKCIFMYFLNIEKVDESLAN